MSDFGFSDEATERRRPPREKRSRRPSALGVAFTVGTLALVVFGVWAWIARSHSDDLAAWNSLEKTFEVMDRSLVPLGHSEAPPCRDQPAGIVTRTYPPSTGPQAAEVIGYLTQSGWSREAPPAPESGSAPVLARLTMVDGGAELTIDVTGPGLTQLAGPVTGRSPGSTVGCLGR